LDKFQELLLILKRIDLSSLTTFLNETEKNISHKNNSSSSSKNSENDSAVVVEQLLLRSSSVSSSPSSNNKNLETSNGPCQANLKSSSSTKFQIQKEFKNQTDMKAFKKHTKVKELIYRINE
jgi:hypothetical protein